jgi:hypothetical protein
VNPAGSGSGATPLPDSQPVQPYPPAYPAQPGPAQPIPVQPYPAPAPYSAPPYPGYPAAYPGGAAPAAYPGGYYPGYPVGYPGYPVPPTRPRRTWLRWLLGSLAGAMVLCLFCVAGVLAIGDLSGSNKVQASWRPGGAAVNAPPAQTAPATEWSAWARRSIDSELTAQAAALLAGDEDKYLAPVDPANAGLVSTYHRLYRNLHAMGLGVFTEAVTGGLTPDGTRSWHTDVAITYCFGTSSCRTVALPVGTAWQFKNDRLLLVDLKQSSADWDGPRPWETDDLKVALGKRVVIATTSENAWRLPDAVAAADRAAVVADRFAKWEDAPSRYVIFLAGPAEWKHWYGHEQPGWAAAWAVPVSNTVTEVVVRTQVVQQAHLEELLRHELTHVTSLAGKRDGIGNSSWWLVEGIAEYAMMSDKPVADYDALDDTRTFVHGKWDGDPAVGPPGVNAPVAEAGARYGVAFLCVRRIADKYGEDKMVTFWGQIVHDDTPIDQAARSALGVSWSTARGECVKFIRASTA